MHGHTLAIWKKKKTILKVGMGNSISNVDIPPPPPVPHLTLQHLLLYIGLTDMLLSYPISLLRFKGGNCSAWDGSRGGAREVFPTDNYSLVLSLSYHSHFILFNMNSCYLQIVRKTTPTVAISLSLLHFSSFDTLISRMNNFLREMTPFYM